MLPHTKEELHHAYFLLSKSRGEAVKGLMEYLACEMELVISGNPDLLIRSYEKMSMDHAREIKDVVISKPLNKRFCIFEVGMILPEAQNALLKLFEDPPSDTHFFLLAETESFLLPTLKSRLFMYRISSQKREDATEANAFLTSNVTERMKMAHTISEQGNEAVRAFLDALEREIKKTPEHVDVLPKIVEAKEFLLLPSAHKKGILETIGLML